MIKLPLVPGPSPMHPCARCATVQETCCQVSDVFVTEGDRARIEAHVGRADFWERRIRVPAWEYDETDPDWFRMTTRADGTNALLERRPNGDCTFLGKEGCVLPSTVRPLICRIFPFYYTEKGLDSEEDLCPRSLLAVDGEPMATVLGIRAEDAEAWRAQLYAELREGTP